MQAPKEPQAEPSRIPGRQPDRAREEVLRAVEERRAADAERIAEAVERLARFSESVNARLETLTRRLEAAEQQIHEQALALADRPDENPKWSKARREQSAHPNPAPAANLRETVEHGLRALAAGRRESGPADGE